MGNAKGSHCVCKNMQEYMQECDPSSGRGRGLSSRLLFLPDVAASFYAGCFKSEPIGTKKLQEIYHFLIRYQAAFRNLAPILTARYVSSAFRSQLLAVEVMFVAEARRPTDGGRCSFSHTLHGRVPQAAPKRITTVSAPRKSRFVIADPHGSRLPHHQAHCRC